MSSRIRKERPAPGTINEEQQIWNAIRSHLRSLEKLQTSSAGNLLALDQRRKRFAVASENGAEAGEAKTELKAAYRKLEGDYHQEQEEIERVLEKVEVLIGVRGGEEAGTSAGLPSEAAAGRRKKRRLDGGSISPTPDRAFSPSSNADVDSLVGDRKPRKGHQATSSSSTTTSLSTGAGSSGRRMTSSNSFSSKDGILPDASASSAGAVGNKDASYVDPARARREVLAHQLPLKKGRKVAFRQPSKNKYGPGAANVAVSSSGRAISSTASFGASQGGSDPNSGQDEDGETWIMATVIECINNDKNRYVVQDEEDPAEPTYNTTLKAVVPLPDHPRTLPPEDYKPGTHVLGLYPDTSCFYRAIVRGGGPGLGGRSSKKARKPDELLNALYHLEFEDDDGAIRDVPATLVVERP